MFMKRWVQLIAVHKLIDVYEKVGSTYCSAYKQYLQTLRHRWLIVALLRKISMNGGFTVAECYLLFIIVLTCVMCQQTTSKRLNQQMNYINCMNIVNGDHEEIMLNNYVINLHYK